MVRRIVGCTLFVLGCSMGQPPAPRVRDDGARIASAPIDAAPGPDDALCRGLPYSPATLEEALTNLRAKGLGASADAIARRVAQRKPKMKLTEQEGLAAASALLEVAEQKDYQVLALVMPRSAVELARAQRERDVSPHEAAAIARYLVHVVDKLGFERLHVFDENHSHVTGRDWQDIDYTGEGMTWQSQRAFWTPRGVTSFKRSAYIHAYFVGAEKLPHWQRVYKPRGRMVDVAAP